MERPKPKSKAWAPVATILSVIFMFICGLFAPRGWNWALVMFFMIAFVAAIGKSLTDRFLGIFINERHKMSLSRFQVAIWTLIVLSAFLTIALNRINAGVDNPLAIALPPQLWALLGISATSLVGSPLVLSTKVSKTPNDTARYDAVPLFAEKLSATDVKETDPGMFAGLEIEAPEQADSKELAKLEIAAKKEVLSSYIIDEGAERFGILDFNWKYEDANFSDMFTGDELGNKGLIDIAKVQKFFFTIIIAFSYMVLLVNLIMTTADPATLNSFPELSDGLVALLGISSAGYLTNKAPDHTPKE